MNIKITKTKSQKTILNEMESICKKAFECKNILEIKDLIKDFNDFKNNKQNIKIWDYPHLLDSVFTELLSVKHSFIANEFHLHKKFKENYKLFFPKAEILKVKNSPENIPDFWLKENNVIFPVEIKLKKFDKTALSQLLKYMDFYKSEKGVAVAPILKTKLPENITFIKLNID